MPPRRTDRAPLGAPILVLNLKSYPAALGPAAARIALSLGEQGKAAGVPVAVCPSGPDLGQIAGIVRYPVLAQHVDLVEAGATTGRVPPEALVAAGVRGSLVNHSEFPVDPATARRTVRRLTDLGLVPIVCAGTIPAARRLAALRPPYLAIEPPELIGGDRAVSTARPELVEGAVRAVGRVSRSTRVLCGAGVHDRRDVQRALELGSEGILVASAVARAREPSRAIGELLAGF